jgi:tetratricopeptide (TPR) repeat protein
MPEETTDPKPSHQNAPKPRVIWFGFAVREPTSRGSLRLRLRWGRISVLLLILAISGWMAKSAGLYFFFKEFRDFDDVAFTDMILFPLNRDNVRIEQGNYQVEQGQLAMERQDYRRAYVLLREGVARSPGNVEGRMLLARIYAGWRPDLANDLLIEGVDGALDHPEYAQLLCALLLREKEDERLLQLVEELDLEALDETIRRQFLVAQLQAALLNGRYTVVKEIFESSDISGSLDGVMLGTEMYIRAGEYEYAANVLLSVINSLPEADLDPIYNQLVKVFKAQGNFDRAREAAIELVIRNPLEWQPRILLIDVLSASERLDRRDREIEAMLQRHRNDEEAMVGLAQLTAEYGNVPAASRLYELALENGYVLSLFSLTLAEAMVNNGEHAKAIELCNELVRENPGWLVDAEGSFNSIRSLAYFGVGDTELGNLYLNNFLDSRRGTVNLLFQSSKSFQKAGLMQQALRILDEAHTRDPRNEAVLASLIDVEMRLGDFYSINEHLETLIGLRRPNYDLLESIRSRLLSDRFLYTENRVSLLNKLDSILQEVDNVDWKIWTRQSPEEPPSEPS